jgi:hypothetical protein
MSDGPDKTDELYPIAVLIDELKVRMIAAGKKEVGAFVDPLSTMMSSYD